MKISFDDKKFRKRNPLFIRNYKKMIASKGRSDGRMDGRMTSPSSFASVCAA